MRLQVLVATMGQKDLSIVHDMNIKSDVIFANQSDRYSYIEEQFPFGKARMITTLTRGVGINRNLALLHADGEYLLFSDDDMKYTDDYEKIILDAFKKIPDADAIIFNVRSLYGNSAKKVNSKIKKVRFFNAMSYGAIRIAVKRSSIKRENVMFNTNFGGGTDFSSGEDTIFIMDMLKKGLNVYTYPKYIGVVDDQIEKSTWFTGYNKKYYYDKGVFFRSLSKRAANLLCIQDLIRHRFYRESGMNFFQAYGAMKSGINGYLELKKFNIK